MNIDEELKNGRPTSSQIAKESAKSRSNAFMGQENYDLKKIEELNDEVSGMETTIEEQKQI